MVAALFIVGDQVPVIELFEVVGKAANVPPEQIGATVVNVGVTFGITEIVIVVVGAQTPVVGVKVYIVVVVLSKVGDQVPVIELVEVVGKAANVPPEQIGATGVNVGVTFGITEIVIVVVVAH